MATKIRLQRFGRKGYAFYQIVIADSRAPRDGKFIERIGSFNPNTNPATIDLKFDRALYWLQTGAQPTDTTRMILSREGVCLKKHLLEGVKKGAFDEETANKKFEAWLLEKNISLQKVKDSEREKKKTKTKTLLDAEKEVNKAKAEELAKKRSDLAAVARAAAAAAAPATPVTASAAPAVAIVPTPAPEEAAPTAEEAAPVEAAPTAEEAAPVEAAPVPEEDTLIEAATSDVTDSPIEIASAEVAPSDATDTEVTVVDDAPVFAEEPVKEAPTEDAPAEELAQED
jgi:small subunit ribosomal protein S16